MIRDASYRGDKISIVDLEMRLVVGNVASSIHVPTCLDELLEMGFEAMRLQQFLQARGMGLAWLDFARFVQYLRKKTVTKRSSDNSTVSQRDVARFPYTSAVELSRFLQHHVFVAIVHQDDFPLETNRSSHSQLELSVIDFVRLLALLRRLVELVQLVSEEDSEQGQIVCDNRTCQKCITMQQVMVLPCVHGVSVMCTKSVDRHQWQVSDNCPHSIGNQVHSRYGICI